MNNGYKKHVFICTNHRDDINKKSCGNIGSDLKIDLKAKIVQKKLNSQIRINASGCLGKCGLGPCLVVYPEGKWKFNVKLNDSDKIIKELTKK